VILSDIEYRIKKKVEDIGVPLKQWDIQINYGIKTGYNEAFIITSDKRDFILKNCKSQDERIRTEKIIRPILRGRDIRRYGFDYKNLWLINFHNGIASKNIEPLDINHYPSIKKHLDKYWDNIKDRDDQGITPYNLRSCAYMEEFSKQKIMYSEIVSGPQFYLDSTGYFLPEATTFIITGDHLDYLYKILNSQIITNIFKRYYAGGGLGLNGYRYKKAFLERLPIVKYTDSQLQKEICTCTNDDNVEEMIAALFGLAKEEIKVMQDYSL
jgi:adenine-specific DNA-methyltransferase